MARCPLCSEHPAKRFCPAKETRICAICCGSKREVEIDCPSSCYHLQAGRAYEADSRIPDPQLVSLAQGFDKSFIVRHSGVLNTLCLAMFEERMISPWMVDSDAIEVLKSLAATMKTLSSGIYYETLPENSLQLSLFRRLKAILDDLMQPDPQAIETSLTVSDAVDVLNFLTLSATVNANSRPRSRQYLDLLESMAHQAAPEQRAGSLIVP